GSSDTGMNARTAGITKGLRSRFDIFFHGSTERAYSSFLNYFRDLIYRFKIAGTGNRKAGFDDIDSHIFEFQGQVQLFGCIEFASRNLLTISEGGVENKNLVVCHSLKKSLKAPERETQSPKLVRCS